MIQIILEFSAQIFAGISFGKTKKENAVKEGK